MRQGRPSDLRTFISPGAGFLAELAVTMGYAVVVILAMQAPASELGLVMSSWSAWLQPALVAMLEAYSGQPCAHQAPLSLLEPYLQLVAVEIGIATLCFLICIPLWGRWAARVKARPRWAAASPSEIETKFQILQDATLAGAVGAVWYLLAGGVPFEGPNCTLRTPWLFLRVPLIVSIGYGLACLSATFGAARPREG